MRPGTKLLCLFCVTWFSANGQNCTELLSQAEQDFRDGRFLQIKQKLCQCFGAYVDVEEDTSKVRPAKMRSMLTEMQAADDEYAAQLGVFRGYWEEFVFTKHEYASRRKDLFTYEERYRAFVLLSKLYHYLGVPPLEEYFASRAVTMHPEMDVETESASFRQVFEGQRRRVHQFSFGPLIGWSYAIPVAKVDYRAQQPDFQYQNDGRVVLGLHLNYLMSPSLTLNVNFWFHGTNIVYTERSANVPDDAQVSFYHRDLQGWLKFPIMLKWSPAKHFYWLKKQETWRSKIFIAGGLSATYLTRSNVTVFDLSSHTSLYDYNVVTTRNRFNPELVLQILTRFQLGQNYINIGFTGTHSFKYILNDSLVKSPENPLYANYGIVENNYRLIGGFWTVTYEYRINYTRR